MNIYDAKERYEKWWVGKYCRFTGCTHLEFKYVVAVKCCGPPSFIYGTASLVFDDGAEVHIPHGDAFKPRKMDVEVRVEPYDTS